MALLERVNPDMNAPVNALKIALVAAVTAALAVAVAAAPGEREPSARADHDVMAPVTRHHEMRSLMRELSQDVERMGAQMEEPAPAQAHRRLAERMEELSGAVAKMSGLLERPAHAAQDKAQLADMQRRLQGWSATSLAAAAAEARG